MDEKQEEKISFLKKLNLSKSHTKLFGAILAVALIAGSLTGYFLASSNKKIGSQIPLGPPKVAQQDIKTFRDFAEGKISKKPEPKNGAAYSEGTHLLVRDGAVPVALTSSVVDLSAYEGKKVTVYGETQKAIKEGWLMDVGRVEEK